MSECWHNGCMAWFYSVFLFLLGLGVGSFLNVLVLRLNTGESVIKGGSRCLNCGFSLRWFELIPVFSFFFQQGRCRHCASRISWQYPIVEFFTGIIFLLIGFNILLLGFFSLLLAISVYDIRHKIVPNQFVYPLIVIAVLFSILILFQTTNYKLQTINPASLADGYKLFSELLTGVGAFVFFAALWAISRGRWMGLGDAKVAFAMGIFLGWPLVLVALLFAFWVAAIWGIFWLLLGHYSRKTQIPFAPFLTLGIFFSFLVGEEFILLYNGIIATI